MQTLPRHLVWVFLIMTFGWGFNWPMLKIGLAEMQPLHHRSLCLIGGAAGVIVIALARGHSLYVPRRDWLRLFVISMFNMAAWNVFAAYGIPLLASGRASIFAFSMPIWATIFGFFLLREPLTARRILGLVLGMAGMLLLLGDETAAAGRSPTGALLMLGAATSWGLAVVIIKRWPPSVGAWTLTAWQLIIAGVPVLTCALLFETGPFFPWQLSLRAALAVSFTLVVTFWICQWAFMEIALRAPTGVTSIATLMTPVVGVFSAALVLGEEPQWQDYVALALVLGAIATILPMPNLKRKAPAP